jgi:hypothetical protein
MSLFVRIRSLFFAFWGIALLTACGSSTPPASAPPTFTSDRANAASWMAPDAVSHPLLYVSDDTNQRQNVVRVYDYRNPAKLLGELTGFGLPEGQCTDSAGDVFITDYWDKNVREYAHGGTKPLETYDVKSYGEPVGCAVDPTTGDLAVSNYEGPGSLAGDVIVYRQGSNDNPKEYGDSPYFYVAPPGFDNAGNLFVEAATDNPTETFGLTELPSGGSAFESLTLQGATIGYFGSVAWDGKYLAVTDQAPEGQNVTDIYRVKVSGSVAQVVSTVTLTDSCSPRGDFNDVPHPWIAGHAVIGQNWDCKHRFDYWSYPKGGNPIRSLPSGITPKRRSDGEAVSG